MHRTEDYRYNLYSDAYVIYTYIYAHTYTYTCIPTYICALYAQIYTCFNICIYWIQSLLYYEIPFSPLNNTHMYIK